jgi:hypothetical protein
MEVRMVKSVRDPASEESSSAELSEIRPVDEAPKRRHEAVTRNERRRRPASEPPRSVQPGSEPFSSPSGRAPALGEDTADAQRALRVSQKAARAQALFRYLPPDDPRARLLKVALLRSDEVLIDALLRRLDSVPPRSNEP